MNIELLHFITSNLSIMFMMILFYYAIVRCENKNKIIYQIVSSLLMTGVLVATYINTYSLEGDMAISCKTIFLLVMSMFLSPAVMIEIFILSTLIKYTFISGWTISSETGPIIVILIGQLYYHIKKKTNIKLSLFNTLLIVLIAHSITIKSQITIQSDNHYTVQVHTLLLAIITIIYSLVSTFLLYLMQQQEKILSIETEILSSNSQLLNSEQQLRASEQQLQASNQQLQASNQQLHASETELERLARLPAENPCPVMRISKAGEVTYANKAAETLIQNINTATVLKDYAEQSLISGKTIRYEIDQNDNSYSILVVPFAENKYVNLYGTDITARKQVEDKLAKSEQLLKESSKIAKIGGWGFDVENGIGEWTEQTAIIHDLEPTQSASEQEGLAFFTGIHREKIEKAIAHTIATGEGYDLELEITTAKGVRKWVRTVGEATMENGVVVRLSGFMQDITELKNAADSLALSREKYEYLIQHINSAIICWDSQGIITFVNEYTQKMFGYSKDEMLGRHLVGTIAPGIDTTGVNISDLVNNIIKHPEQHVHVESENMHKDGHRIWIRWNNRAVFDVNGNIEEMLSVGTDITEQKIVQDMIQDYNKKLEQEVDARTEELAEKNELLTQEINVRLNAEKELKETQSQLVESEKMVTIGRLAAGVAHELNTPLGAIGSTNTTLNINFTNLLKECDYFSVHFNKYHDQIYSLIERLFATESIIGPTRLRRQKKQEIADKVISSGFDNAEAVSSFLVESNILDDYEQYLEMLTSDMSELIIERINKIATIIQGMRVIDSAINQSSRIVFALREYARASNSSKPVKANIKSTIETAIVLYGNKIKHGIDLKFECEELPEIMCVPNELCQVWTNLIHNAVQAMEGKGELEIKSIMQDNGIRVTIKDSGSGIPEDIISKIFDPMFTTKPAGYGTGLGLDISKRIIERHKGTISVESEAGKGATFTVWLPISETVD